jgi:hypothetical protein
MPHLNLGIAQFYFSCLNLKGGIVKILGAQLIFKIGVLNVSIVSGIELKSVNAGCSICVFSQQTPTCWRFDERDGVL